MYYDHWLTHVTFIKQCYVFLLSCLKNEFTVCLDKWSSMDNYALFNVHVTYCVQCIRGCSFSQMKRFVEMEKAIENMKRAVIDCVLFYPIPRAAQQELTKCGILNMHFLKLYSFNTIECTSSFSQGSKPKVKNLTYHWIIWFYYLKNVVLNVPLKNKKKILIH